MSGVKLTIFLPTLNHLIKEVISTVANTEDSSNAQAHYILVLCHSTMRCAEVEAFLREVTTFCADIVDVVGLYSGDKADNSIALK